MTTPMKTQTLTPTRLLNLLLLTLPLRAYPACWIAYPGEHAIDQANRLMARRNNHGQNEPAPWAAYAPHLTVTFWKQTTLHQDTLCRYAAQGTAFIKKPGRPGPEPNTWIFPKGDCAIEVRVTNPGGIPAFFLESGTIQSDESWETDTWADDRLPVETFPACTTPTNPPAQIRPARQPQKYTSIRPGHAPETLLIDYGKETYGYLKVTPKSGKGRWAAVFAEWEEEAQDPDLAHAENLERFLLEAQTGTIELPPRGFRYVRLQRLDGNSVLESVSLDREVLPIEVKGCCRCSDDLVNRIWDVSLETLRLTSREVFLDGIKRDHWMWAGDSRQSCLMNWYSLGDEGVCRRTLWALRGHDPMRVHLNWIMDYTFFWLISVGEHYRYTGDRRFLRQIWPRMKRTMAFVEGRLNGSGLAVSRGDWIFVDWSPRPMKTGSAASPGAVCFEQMLLVRAYESLASAAEALGFEGEALVYRRKGAGLKARVLPLYWDESRGALFHYLDPDGKTVDRSPGYEALTRYPNIFGVLWDYFSEEQLKRVLEGVLLNDEVMRIQTPYMRFYELEALLKLGRHEQVLEEIRSYWGGMLALGATSFWELYNPAEKGREHMAMYGRPYGRSACHSWGASPLYLLGRYFLGVEPLTPGFATYSVRPCTGGLAWMEGTVPTPSGTVRVSVRDGRVSLTGCGGRGTLHWKGEAIDIPPYGTVTR